MKDELYLELDCKDVWRIRWYLDESPGAFLGEGFGSIRPNTSQEDRENILVDRAAATAEEAPYEDEIGYYWETYEDAKKAIYRAREALAREVASEKPCCCGCNQ